MMIHPPRKRPLSRYERDARIGYSAMGVSAVAFVMVMVASFVVIKVAPNLDLGVPAALAPTQTVVKHPVLSPVAARTPPSRETGRPGAGSVASAVTPQAPGTVPAGTTDPDPDPVEPVDPGPVEPEPVDPDPVDPEPGRPGVASGLVDPVVEGVTGTLDQLTGGATEPVTGPVGGVTDDVTDTVDGLVGGLLGTP
ncbi:hypothetical protein SAMN05216561_10477 [Nocardioides psychrotolerans]|uniref:Uncharacterized protein n=2 Tax=Nocardioides psychrotolerans TaxID=1005945 RepID=A0A1I3EUL2_9ACTN|nr:hypothetical protein SAMN05216561_10477 [Nocardioides psychrotolerans]